MYAFTNWHHYMVLFLLSFRVCAFLLLFSLILIMVTILRCAELCFVLFCFCDRCVYLPWVPPTILLSYLLSLLSCPDAAGSCIDCATQRLRLRQHHHHIWLDCEFRLGCWLFLCVHLFFVWGWEVVVLEHVGTGVTVLLNEQWFEVHALSFKFKSYLETAPISSMSKWYKNKCSLCKWLTLVSCKQFGVEFSCFSASLLFFIMLLLHLHLLAIVNIWNGLYMRVHARLIL